MARIIDIDVLVPDVVTVRSGGVDYDIPGDPPVSMWLGIVDAYEEFQSATGEDAVKRLRVAESRMLDLFRLRNPGLDTLPLGPGGIYAVLLSFYGDDPSDTPDPPRAQEAAPGQTKTTSGRANSATKGKKTATRSRSSS